jgi:ribosomal-protein-alanine N-acetyltransferase
MERIETNRLIIRRFRLSDWKDLHEYLSDSNVVQFEPYDVLSEDECRLEATNRIKNNAFWAVCLKESGKMIGNIYFKQLEPDIFLTWELGYVFNANYHGKGYATESCAAIINYAFECMNVRRVIAKCNPKNTQSWKLLERLKLRREGHLLKTAYFKCDFHGKPLWHDTYEYAMLQEEWADLLCEKVNSKVD